MREVVIAINPGSTSTKYALVDRNEIVYEETVRHPQEEIDKYDIVTEQIDFRYSMIKSAVDAVLAKEEIKVVGAVGRGGLVKPLKGGTYRVSELMKKDLMECKYANHASNLGALIADKIAKDFGFNDSYIVDPVTTDNMWDKARLSGHPDIIRFSRVHALNIKSVARHVSEMKNMEFDNSNFVVAHLGGGISIAALEKGRLVDVSDGLLGMGPFSPERAGAMPLAGIINMCYSKPQKEVVKIFSKQSGFKAYLGTNDFREIEKMVLDGDKKAVETFDAFIYQIIKEIGAYAAALKGKVDAVIITGGCAYAKKVVEAIKEHVSWIADVVSYPGENELTALAEGAFRVIDGKEVPEEY